MCIRDRGGPSSHRSLITTELTPSDTGTSTTCISTRDASHVIKLKEMVAWVFVALLHDRMHCSKDSHRSIVCILKQRQILSNNEVQTSAYEMAGSLAMKVVK